MSKLIPVALLALVLAACSSGTNAGVTTTTGSDGGGASTSSTTSSVPVSGNTTTTTATVAAGGGSGGGGDCIVGTWEMDSERFFEALLDTMTPEEAAAGSFEFAGGWYRVIVGADGSFTDQRTDWSFDVASDAGAMTMTINQERTGTYEVNGGAIAVSLPGDVPADVTMSVDGQPFVFPPGVQQPSPPAVEYESAPFNCDGDSLTITSDEGITVYWTRVG